MNRLLAGVSCVILMLLSHASALAEDSSWPRTLPLEQGSVTVYQLQVDEMESDVIHFRAALAYRATADAEPVFGAGWFESPVEIDSSRRIVHPTNLKVTETRFPAGTDDVQSELSTVLAQQSPTWNLDFSLDELQESLKMAEAESEAVQNLNTTPPQVIYRDHPALLISMDGEPVLREIENSPYQAVINTPYPLIFDGQQYYLNAAKDVWYRAGNATGPYQFEARPPAEIASMVNAEDQDEQGTAPTDPQQVETITAANAPEIVVSTKPAELIVTEGPAAFVPLVDDLLVLQNSDDDVFMHVKSQQFYIVLAGRWYHARSLNGPWEYQSADDLPEAFANIPRDSNQADSRVYVAGTEEARDAVLDAQVPQTVAVSRGEVDIEVDYDGEPIFKPVDGTDLVYAQNTGSSVILSDGLYYLVEDGVWYVSSSPNGPWQVSTYRPDQVSAISPTSPLYNVKYVYVYDSTPSVVYVGHTPGYYGSYVYNNTIFYGSGWNYSPWVSPSFYYSRFNTWGFNVNYDPWYGWNFGLSWGWGPFSVNFFSGGFWHNNHYWHHRHWGGWGPGRYRSRHYGRHGYGNRYANTGRGRNQYASGGDRRGGDGRGGDGRGGEGRGGEGRGGDGRNAIGARGSNRDQRIANPGRDGRQRDGAADNRERNFASQGKAGRNRIDPVSPSDMRLKAEVRDANSAVSPSRSAAGNGGKNKSGHNRTDPVNRSDLRQKAEVRDANFAGNPGKSAAGNGGKNKSGHNRTDPVNRSDLRQKAEVRDANFAGNPGKSAAGNGGKNKSGHNRTDPVNRSDLRQKAEVRDTNFAGNPNRSPTGDVGKNKSGHNRTDRVNRSDLRQKAGGRDVNNNRLLASNSVKQKSSTGIKLPSGQTQAKALKNSARRAPARDASAPAQRPDRSGPGRQQSSQNTSRNSSARGRGSAQSSRQSSSRQSSGASGGSRRSGGSRSRRQ